MTVTDTHVYRENYLHFLPCSPEADTRKVRLIQWMSIKLYRVA